MGSEQSTTKQPFSSLAASLRGGVTGLPVQQIIEPTNQWHPPHTHTRVLPSLILTDPEESRPSCRSFDNFNFFFNLTQQKYRLVQKGVCFLHIKGHVRRCFSLIIFSDFCLINVLFFLIVSFKICILSAKLICFTVAFTQF